MNTFYTGTWTGAANAIATKSTMIAQYDLIAAGFVLAGAETGAAMRAMTPDTLGALAAAASRVGKVLAFDSNGAIELEAINDSDLFEDAATNLMPTTFASTLTASAAAGVTETYVSWDGAALPNIGSVWTKHNLEFVVAATVVNGGLRPSSAGLYLVQYSFDMVPNGIDAGNQWELVFQAGDINDGTPSFEHVVYDNQDEEDWYQSTPGNRINAVWIIYFDGASDLAMWVKHVFGSVSATSINITNAKISFIKLAIPGEIQ